MAEKYIYNPYTKEIEGARGGVLYDAESLEHLSQPARVRLAELSTIHDEWDYVTCEASLIAEGLFVPDAPVPSFFTPGPWMLSETLGVYGPNEPRPNGQSYRKLIRPAIQTEAQAAQYGGTLAEQTANARLIAAAPELLAVVKNLVACMYAEPEVYHPAFQDSARRALTKALG